IPGGGGWPIRKRHVSKTRDPKRVSTRSECAEGQYEGAGSELLEGVLWQLMIGSEGI
ncbi:hypothetical protein Tco_0238982, partial [Tanacetum coccineum]